MIVKALSVRQPWAWLILHGGKDVENRTWRANARGAILLHASSNMSSADYERCRDFAVRLGVTVPEPAELERGGIVGAFRLAGVAKPGERASPWHFEECFGFQIEGATPLPFRPAKGRLYFFGVETTAAERRLLRRAGLLP